MLASEGAHGDRLQQGIQPTLRFHRLRHVSASATPKQVVPAHRGRGARVPQTQPLAKPPKYWPSALTVERCSFELWPKVPKLRPNGRTDPPRSAWIAGNSTCRAECSSICLLQALPGRRATSRCCKSTALTTPGPREAGLHHVTQVTSRRGAMSLPQLQLSGGIVRNRIIEPRG